MITTSRSCDDNGRFGCYNHLSNKAKGYYNRRHRQHHLASTSSSSDETNTSSPSSSSSSSSSKVQELTALLSSSSSPPTTVEEASMILSIWDRYYNAQLEARKKTMKTTTPQQSNDLFIDMTSSSSSSLSSQQQQQQPQNSVQIIDPQDGSNNEEDDNNIIDPNMEQQLRTTILPTAVQILSDEATKQRIQDPTTGRCMLGICAPSTQIAISELKSYVTTLQLPRGLLHGMDQDGIPIQLNGGVYIKYNSGGVYTFEDIRKSGLGFEALWKPGDAMIEPYNDGYVEGVYVQVELNDGIFRQYLVPLNLFDNMDVE